MRVRNDSVKAPSTRRTRARAGWKRRRFLGAGVTAAAAAAAGCGGQRSPWRFLSLQEAFTLEAVAQQLIPADQDAGAREAGVVNFIDRQLVRSYKRFQEAYRTGIAALDRLASSKFGAPFAQLEPEKQTAALQEFERSDKPFFDMVLAHSLQGFYGDPRHGGNRDWVSWRMIGVPPLPVRGRKHYDFTKPNAGLTT